MKQVLIMTILLGVSPSYATDYGNVQRVEKIQEVIIPQKRVEFDDRIFYGLDGYYSVGNNLREAQLIENNRANDVQLNELRREMARLAGQQEIIAKLLQLKEEKLKVDVETNNVKVDVEANTEPLSDKEAFEQNIDAAVFNIFKNKCATCHGPDADYSPQLIGKDNKGYFLPSSSLTLEDRAKIYDRTKGVHLKERGLSLMPKGGDPLSDEEVEALFLYMMRISE